MSFGEYIGAGPGTTKLLLHLSGNSTDSSGNNNNGTDTAITYVDGKFRKCASFNGSSSQIQSTVTGDSVFTINTWVKITSFPGMTGYFFNRRNTANNANYGIYLNSSSQFGLNCYDGFTGPFFATDATFSTGVWYNVVEVFNGASSAIYVNGKLSKSGTLLTHTSGNDTFLGANSGVNFYTGLIDETIIENIAWTPQQVAKYYSYAKGYYAIL
jgi:hypothetical protein